MKTYLQGLFSFGLLTLALAENNTLPVDSMSIRYLQGYGRVERMVTLFPTEIRMETYRVTAGQTVGVFKMNSEANTFFEIQKQVKSLKKIPTRPDQPGIYIAQVQKGITFDWHLTASSSKSEKLSLQIDSLVHKTQKYPISTWSIQLNRNHQALNDSIAFFAQIHHQENAVPFALKKIEVKLECLKREVPKPGITPLPPKWQVLTSVPMSEKAATKPDTGNSLFLMNVGHSITEESGMRIYFRAKLTGLYQSEFAQNPMPIEMVSSTDSL